jgi:carboxyl-terminal processing protease
MEENNTVVYDLKKVPLRSERRERRKRRAIGLVFFLCCLLCVGLGFFIARALSSIPDKGNNDVTAYQEIRQIMNRYWLYGDQYEDLDQELEDKALYGMTAFDFDPYTSYMSAEEMNSFSDSINGNYVGIGVEYSYVNSKALIMKVFYSSPAEKAGLQAGDAIIGIDGTDVSGLDTEGIRELVLGEEGTDVILTIERGTEVFDVPVTRGVVNSTVFAYAQDRYIFMELNSFGASTCEECIKYLDAYPDKDRIIIDLRGNGGGYQGSVRDICGLFIGPDQVYLRQKGIDGVESVDVTPKDSRYFENLKKIVLLVSKDTASAAEVFTIALKEKCPDVTIVGETTYGKGVIQTNRILRNGGVLKLTSYYWYSPNGVSIDKTGIEPDVEVLMPDIYYQTYFEMDDDETYEYDSVSNTVLVTQKALDYLGYEVERSDGYFDRSLADALRTYKADRGLPEDEILDQQTFNSIVSETRRELSNNREKDTQFQKALEIIEN